MKRLLLPLLAVAFAVPAFAQPATPLDGDWKGRSDGGSCNAPLDYLISIDTGIVDGSAFDTTAHGPVPNLRHGAPPPPGPGLWQIHGVARGNSFSLLSVASTKGEAQQRMKLDVTVQGGTLTVRESGGCGRTATLTK
ncbi:MAG TPA: hypothetical protein VMI56_07165 [Reyranella sp.]|nr:hypothetical protein [Reyranella sp.]